MRQLLGWVEGHPSGVAVVTSAGMYEWTADAAPGHLEGHQYLWDYQESDSPYRTPVGYGPTLEMYVDGCMGHFTLNVVITAGSQSSEYSVSVGNYAPTQVECPY